MPSECGSATPHRIGYAVKMCRLGKAVTRRGWKVKGQRVTLDGVGDGSYLRLTTRSGRSWPFTLGHRDVLADDWMVVEAA